MTPEVWVELVKFLGLPTVIVIFLVWSGNKKLWVFGWIWRQENEEKKYWRNAFMKLANLSNLVVKELPKRSGDDE